ncbi:MULTISPECIES: cytochrome P450 [unclassified Bradyrhizobium]|uniref:cytochrome P450 n=1 Tax=unclassified Bradyrhizobium TaxID=2631580 RepID=UPI001BAC6587|nr:MULTISPECIES: cytochrome P450 [unclassified Bradyrhizobium]MBR1228761.1 cytochrome P450 [Bradyrhizobium sp. AUGA SZCCT0176]MBR1299688.1 cytochrome P450 [Bradyrhizobium sp. AUGA SZCCT0042]
MRLLSEDFPLGLPAGPVFPRAYPEVEPDALSNVELFLQGQPFDIYAQLRAEAPVAWQREGNNGPGFWALTQYNDVMRVDGDPKTFSSQKGGILMAYGPPETRHPLLFRASVDAMINMDAPWHLQLRKEHMPYFTPGYLTGIREKVAIETTRLIDGMAGLGECDMVETLSSRLPLFTLCEILGVPEADRPKFLDWMHYLEVAGHVAATQRKNPQPTPEFMAFVKAFNENVAEMFAYGQHMLQKRRADPKPDLMSAIARATIDGELLRDEYLDGSWLLIVFAGNDTTRNSISGSMKLLTEFPDQKRALMSDLSLMPNAVDELIRMISPVIYMRRTATEDTEIGAQKIAAGEKVIMYYGAANRDPAIFPDPDRLDIRRANASRNIAFGFGPHVCIGKRVAQLQLEEVYRQLLTRLPDIEYAGGIEMAPNNFVHAIRKLPVRFTPQRSI